MPSHGGHIDGLLAAGVLKEHGDRRHFTHDPTPVQQWRPCRVTLYVSTAFPTVIICNTLVRYQQTHEERPRGAKHCDPPSVRPDPVQGALASPPVSPSCTVKL